MLNTPPITPPTIAPVLDEPLLLEGVELVVDPPVVVPVVDGPFEEEGVTLVVEVLLKFAHAKLVLCFGCALEQPHPAVSKLTLLC